MSEDKELRYFNFPIALLSGYLDHPKEVMSSIWNYAIYCKSLDYEYGDDIDKIESAKKFLRVKGGNDNDVYENGALQFSLYKNSPKVGLSVSTYFDYKKNEKTEFQKVCLLGYLGIKSILQNKAYCKLTNKYWLSRMDGKSNAVNDYSELSESIQKYANEYQTKKIKSELRDNWFLATYSRYTRGFYVSFNLELDELVFQAEKRRKSTKEKQARLAQKIALEKAISRLND